MPIDRFTLIDRFGAAVDTGVGALFVGAGLSAAAGIPNWNALLAPLAKRIGLDVAAGDLPLLAEYIEQDPGIGRDELEAHILSEITKGFSPTDGHRAVGRLPVREVWTTNYDRLIEEAVPDARVAVFTDDDLMTASGGSVVIKMHGSTNAGGSGWDCPPVITRGDYERYEEKNPRMWALLRATYLTRTMLFLGFSFSDPNVGLLLQLARRYGTSSTDRHLTVLRRPTDAVEARLHDLNVRDLETSGVSVCEIEDHQELLPLLNALVRRSQPPRFFVSGSGDESTLRPWCERLAHALASRPTRWEIASLGGEAGWWTTQNTAALRRHANEYRPDHFLLFFRKKEGEGAPDLDARVGTAIFSDLEREPLVQSVLDECRAVVILGGGERTLQEAGWARERGLGVVPVAASGGAARTVWEQLSTEQPRLGGQDLAAEVWTDLASDDPDTAVQAAIRALDQAMYKTLA